MAKASLAKRRAARKNYAKVAKKSPAGAPGGPRSKALLAAVEAGSASHGFSYPARRHARQTRHIK